MDLSYNKAIMKGHKQQACAPSSLSLACYFVPFITALLIKYSNVFLSINELDNAPDLDGLIFFITFIYFIHSFKDCIFIQYE